MENCPRIFVFFQKKLFWGRGLHCGDREPPPPNFRIYICKFILLKWLSFENWGSIPLPPNWRTCGALPDRYLWIMPIWFFHHSCPTLIYMACFQLEQPISRRWWHIFRRFAHKLDLLWWGSSFDDSYMDTNMRVK